MLLSRGPRRRRRKSDYMGLIRLRRRRRGWYILLSLLHDMMGIGSKVGIFGTIKLAGFSAGRVLVAFSSSTIST